MHPRLSFNAAYRKLWTPIRQAAPVILAHAGSCLFGRSLAQGVRNHSLILGQSRSRLTLCPAGEAFRDYFDGGEKNFRNQNLAVVGATGIEPVTPTMSRWCSTAALRAHTGAGY